MAKTKRTHSVRKSARPSRAYRRDQSRRKPAAGGRAATAARGAGRAKPRKQRFVARHLGDHDFEEGLRSYAKYRDLGIAGATGGMVRAHVIRMVPPCDPATVSKRHFHDVDFQMIYVLKGWIKGEYDGAGVVTMREGSCWLQPPRIKHTVLDYSDDCELLEIIMPADFNTVELD